MSARRPGLHLTSWLLGMTVLLSASSALAQAPPQHAYVVSYDSRDVTVIDLRHRRVVDTWRTDRNPRGIDVSPDGGLVFVAANHDLTILDIKAPHSRIDVEFQILPFGALNLQSTGVAVADGGRKVFVSQRLSDEIVMIDLDDPNMVACLANHTQDCNPGSAESRIPLPFSGGEHVATSPYDGAVFVVNADGRVARGRPGTWTFSEITPGSGNLPAFPGGLAVAANGDVIVSANANCTHGIGCLVRFERARGFALAQLPYGFESTGGVDINDRGEDADGTIYDILVALPDEDAVGIVDPRNGLRYSYTGLGVGPQDVAFTPAFTHVTANVAHLQRPGSSATITYSGNRAYVEAGTTPVAVAIGPLLQGRLAADPGELRFVYASLGQYVGVQTVRLTNTGYAELRLGYPGVSGRDRANFTIVRNGCGYARLPIGASCEIDVDFRAGSYDGLIRLATASYGAALSVPHGSSLGISSVPLRAEHLTAKIDRKLELKRVPLPGLSLGGD